MLGHQGGSRDPLNSDSVFGGHRLCISNYPTYMTALGMLDDYPEANIPAAQ
jgi:hypothetical protein